MDREKVLLGVTGGIAAYKSAELVRLLIKAGFDTGVIMTPAATNLIAPLTFKSLSGHPVYVDLFEQGTEKIRHIELAKWPSIIIVAPATANTLGKMASGIADNLLTTVVLAASVPVLLVPSMNVDMYNNPMMQDNLKRLRDYGFSVMEPEEGLLACGVEGRGRMPEPEKIVRFAINILKKGKDFAGKKVLVTAGPTREPLDPVRYLGNYSTGKMGFALARALKERGAEVCLVRGDTDIPPPDGIEVIKVNTAMEMMEEVDKRFPRTDIIIKAAAVADYRPAKVLNRKIKKGEKITLELVPNPDILSMLGTKKEEQMLVGFAAETENLMENARQKLKAKNLDLIVANDLTIEGAGFATDTNKVTIITRHGKVYELPLMSKYEVAHRLLDIIRETQF